MHAFAARRLMLLQLTSACGWPTPPDQTNPFASNSFYAHPPSLHIPSSLPPPTLSLLTEISSVPSAFWVDTKARLTREQGGDQSLEAVLAGAFSQSPPPLVVLILYNLPNRDCHAKASNGEICCARLAGGECDYLTASCEEGMREYIEDYIEPFSQLLKTFSEVPAAVVIEPDSLPNLATNLQDPRCGSQATQEAYKRGVEVAIEKLHAAAPHASLYLDAGHGGWLGWKPQAIKYIQLLSSLRDPDAAEPAYKRLRGFASNVANYQPLGSPCPGEPAELQAYCIAKRDTACCRDPCGLIPLSSNGNNELNYARLLHELAKQVLQVDTHFLIDTSRNGVDDAREDCSNWCNIRGAGAGPRPTSQTALPSLVDAYYWLKTPGQSDGCTLELPTRGQCARFDSMCTSVDSIGSDIGEPRAPEAGEWFIPQLAELACRAVDGPRDGECDSIIADTESLVAATDPMKSETGIRVSELGVSIEGGLLLDSQTGFDDPTHRAGFSVKRALLTLWLLLLLLYLGYLSYPRWGDYVSEWLKPSRSLLLTQLAPADLDGGCALPTLEAAADDCVTSETDEPHSPAGRGKSLSRLSMDDEPADAPCGTRRPRMQLDLDID